MGRSAVGGCAVGHGFRGSRKKGLFTILQNEIAQEIGALLGQESIADLDLEAVEMAARRQALLLAARALEQRLNGDLSDHMGPALPCPCGAQAQYRGRHEKTFTSALGRLRLERAYYHCDRCESGFCPRDRALGLEKFSLTPAALRMAANAAALLSFEESSGLLRELAGVEISIKQVERAAESLGAEIAADERNQTDRTGEMARTMYLGMDGTGVPMRAPEVADRAGKQADGSAKTREAKLVPVWTAEGRDEEGKPVRDPDRFVTRRRLRVPPAWIPIPSCRNSPRGWCAKLPAAVSAGLTVRWCLGMARPGSGIRLTSCSPMPFKSSTAFMPRNI